MNAECQGLCGLWMIYQRLIKSHPHELVEEILHLLSENLGNCEL